MEKDLWIGAIIISIGYYLSTETRNNYAHMEEDLFFPQHYRKAGKLFKFLFKQDYLRFSIYWKQKLIIFNFVAYSIILLLGSIISKEFNTIIFEKYMIFLRVNYFVLMLAPMVFDFLIWLSVEYLIHKYYRK